jgi:hypothetical protein
MELKGRRKRMLPFLPHISLLKFGTKKFNANREKLSKNRMPNANAIAQLCRFFF